MDKWAILKSFSAFLHKIERDGLYRANVNIEANGMVCK